MGPGLSQWRGRAGITPASWLRSTDYRRPRAPCPVRVFSFAVQGRKSGPRASSRLVRLSPLHRTDRIGQPTLTELGSRLENAPPPPHPMRLFIALNLPRKEKKRIYNASKHLRDAGFPVRWLEYDRYHLTLKFLGEVRTELVPVAERVIDRVAKETREFPLVISGFGAFPTIRRPRVIWVGVEALAGASLPEAGSRVGGSPVTGSSGGPERFTPMSRWLAPTRTREPGRSAGWTTSARREPLAEGWSRRRWT